MRRVGLSSSIPVAKGAAELNNYKFRELKEVRDGGVFGGQRLSEEDESRINEDVNGSKRLELVISQDVGQRQHLPQGPQGPPLVQWERFLPLRSLKVLLVEDDDCTRHVVSALLRNCSYEVTAVANGLEAWKVLIDLNKQIDLVLTEVVMPYLSGVGLLSKIMNHIPRKNTPVIMMSSDDSMGIVFNCLSKGAVDFLVKPIRKNELKNLWQHVWRKCHSSSGSESESGIHARKTTTVRSNEDSDDDDSEEDDDISIGLTAKDGSDNGSGNQSSWTKKAVEVESGKYSWDQLVGTPDSTCAHLIHASPDTVSTRKQGGEDDKLDAVEMGKDLEIGGPRNPEKNADLNLKETGEPKTISTNNVMVAKANSKGSPTLELSLKRSRDFEDQDTSTHTRNVLRQSGLSAFSRYNNTTSNGNQAPTGNVGSCSPPDVTISSETGKPVNIQSNSNGAPNQPSNGSSTHNNDMGSSTNIAFSKPEPPADDKAILPDPSEGDKAQFQVRHHHHHYHHHHHHVHKDKTQQQQTDSPDEGGSSRNMVSNVAALAEGNAANYGSASGSNNKSNGENGSSGQKGNSYAITAEGGDNGVGEKGKNGYGNGSGSGSGSGRGSGVDPDRLAHREAALNKFRQKRKERCFEKKVRYQSRKKLAEQRPRVRGQFVRQGVNGKDADS